MNKKTISTVESITGGLLATKITDIPGASSFFKGSLITYQKEIKKQFGININNGVVNEETARAMALLGQKTFKSDIVIALTGEAGPIASEKKVGDVYIAILENNKINVYFQEFKSDEKDVIKKRKHIREQCVEFVFEKLNLHNRRK